MNWRRGLLLAGINLVVAVPLIVMLEARDEQNMREHFEPHSPVAGEPASKATQSNEEAQTVEFSPCNLWAAYSVRSEVAWFPNLPATILSGWQQLCPPRWTLAGRLNVGYSWSGSTIPGHRKVCLGFGLLVAIQWILVGAFPLMRPKRWWAEPGTFITCCALIGFGIVIIHPIADFARLPAACAAFAWLWWFGLLMWKSVRFGWQRMTGRRTVAN